MWFSHTFQRKISPPSDFPRDISPFAIVDVLSYFIIPLEIRLCLSDFSRIHTPWRDNGTARWSRNADAISSTVPNNKWLPGHCLILPPASLPPPTPCVWPNGPGSLSLQTRSRLLRTA